MRGNPQNIEVGDVVRCHLLATNEKITAVVLSIWDRGYTHLGDEEAIDGYLVRATVMSKGSFCNYPVKNLTIVRKWNNTDIAPQEVQCKDSCEDPLFTVVFKKPETLTTIAIVSDCIEGIKKRQQEATKSALSLDGTAPCVYIDVSGEVTFTKFWIEQVIVFTEKHTRETYVYNLEDKTVTRFHCSMNPSGEVMSIEEFITSYVSPATTDYLRKDRIGTILKESHGFWCFKDNINPNSTIK